jgi:4-hydroxy-3-methylbut-2-enyl diphosphate reductase
MPTYFVGGAGEFESADVIHHFSLASRSMISTRGWLPPKRPVDVVLTCGASCPDAILDGVLLRVLSFFGGVGDLDEVLAPYAGD